MSEKECIHKDIDNSICKVDLPKYDKNTTKIINRIIKSTDINQLKIYLIKNFKNYNPPKKFINISKTI